MHCTWLGTLYTPNWASGSSVGALNTPAPAPYTRGPAHLPSAFALAPLLFGAVVLRLGITRLRKVALKDLLQRGRGSEGSNP